MKLDDTKKSIQILLKVAIFLGLAVAVIELFPRTDKLNLHFAVGKPWGYDMVTAPFDFPIYKSDKVVAAERKEILSRFVPYFSVDTAVAGRQVRAMRSTLKNEDLYVQQIVTEQFRKVYLRGIISADNLQQLQNEKKTKINSISTGRVSKSVSASNLYTPKTAYEAILTAVPNLYNTLNDYNLNLYLTENLRYDTVASENSRKELLKGMALTKGMIQQGEKIIDRGEIVTSDTYDSLHSLNIEYEKRNTNTQQSLLEKIGEIVLVLVFIMLLFLYLYVFRPRYFDSFGNLLLIVLMISLIVAMTAVILRFTTLSIYLVPFTLLPVIIRVFFDSRTALYSHLVTVLITTLIVDNPFQFVILQITAGMTAVANMKDLTQRGQLMQTALYVFICYTVTYLGLEFISKGQSLLGIHWLQVLYMLISCGIMLFAIILIYFIEKIFGLVSSMTLVELTNINSDFMMSFAEKAPGTFQHTLQVSNLATEAARAINANALLVRTGALYHDIGKSLHPEYFTENQAGGVNPLSKMDYEQAAGLIIAHVTDGVHIAKKQHIPEQIIHFIRTHHGTSKTRYFYNSFVNTHPDLPPNDAAFTYPGPRPTTKEMAILMMVDAVEARSHSLQEYTIENIDTMVEDMIDSQIADGQFKDAPISFLDVEKVKSVLKDKIKSIYHTRIVYPTVEEK